jgi:ADP-ribosylglycohydrolase
MMECMVKSSPSTAARARGLLLAAAAGDSLVSGVVPRPDSPYGAGVALGRILAEELQQPRVDLRRIAERWAAWARRDGRGLGAATGAALEHLREHSAPPAAPAAPSDAGPLAHCMPIALATFDSPRNLVSGTFHTAALTDPDPRSAWAAVGVNMALAGFLQGRRDVVPDVIEVLRGNDVPPELLAVVRRVPVLKRDALGGAGHVSGAAVGCLEAALWLAHHEPRLERGLSWIAEASGLGGGSSAAFATVAGALLGARDGDEAIPERWLEPIPDTVRLRALAERLARIDRVAPE